MAKHDEKPQFGDLSEAEIAEVTAQVTSQYAQGVRALLERIEGKVVARTSAGRSGYCLEFNDSSWVICFLADCILNWRTGSGAIEPVDRELMHDPKAGDTREPLTIDYPYANTVCDLEVQVAQSIGHSVSNIAVGDSSFNLCFPDGHELDASVVPDPKGILGLRVFWEQW